MMGPVSQMCRPWKNHEDGQILKREKQENKGTTHPNKTQQAPPQKKTQHTKLYLLKHPKVL